MKYLKNNHIMIISIYFLILISMKFGQSIPGIDKDNLFMVIVFEVIGCTSIYYLYIKQKCNHEYLLIIFLITLFWDLALISDTTDKQNMPMIVEGTIIFNFCFFALMIKNMFKIKDKISFKNLYASSKKIIKESKYFLLIIVIFVILNLDIFNTWLQADGYDYYSGVNWCTTWDFTRMDKLTLSGHNSQGYVFFILMGEFLYPNAITATRIINIILAVITIIALNGIIKILFNNLSNIERALSVGVIAFSPILFSMMAEINTDYALLCFMIWLIYSYLTNHKILQAFCGLLLCFSKEPGLLIYGMFIISLLTKNTIDYFKDNTTPKLKELFMNVISIPLLVSCVGGCLWLGYYLISESGIGWSDVYATKDIVIKNLNKINTFAIDFKYIFFKLKQIFIMNFMWIFLMIIVISILINIYTKLKTKMHHEIITRTIPIYFLAIATFLYNLIFITWTNYRYIIPAVFFVILATLYAVNNSNFSNITKRLLLIFLVLISLISNYVTEPLAQKVFIEFNTSESSKMIITPRFSVDNGYVYMRDDYTMEKWGWCDTMVYNKQYTYWGHVIDEFLDDIDYDSGKAVIMPLVLSSDTAMYSRFFGRSDKSLDKTIWNKDTRHLEYSSFQGNKSCNYVRPEIKFIDMSSKINLNNYSDYSEVYFVELPLSEYDDMLKNINIIENKNYKYLTCKIKVAKLK